MGQGAISSHTIDLHDQIALLYSVALWAFLVVGIYCTAFCYLLHYEPFTIRGIHQG